VENDEEDVSSNWVTLIRREDTGYWKRKHYIALCGKFALDEAMDS
jgi:hypothetical protein